jgi:hypothetical protein
VSIKERISIVLWNCDIVRLLYCVEPLKPSNQMSNVKLLALVRRLRCFACGFLQFFYILITFHLTTVFIKNLSLLIISLFFFYLVPQYATERQKSNRYVRISHDN